MRLPERTCAHHMMHTVVVPLVQNNKDYFDQSLDEVKLLRAINAADPHDAHGILRLYDFFYYRVRTRCQF
jgi:hypothetical protein